jgi:hypothetical protein
LSRTINNVRSGSFSRSADSTSSTGPSSRISIFQSRPHYRTALLLHLTGEYTTQMCATLTSRVWIVLERGGGHQGQVPMSGHPKLQQRQTTPKRWRRQLSALLRTYLRTVISTISSIMNWNKRNWRICWKSWNT